MKKISFQKRLWMYKIQKGFLLIFQSKRGKSILDIDVVHTNKAKTKSLFACNYRPIHIDLKWVGQQMTFFNYVFNVKGKNIIVIKLLILWIHY
jgi:hypothetical protein